MKRNIFFIFIFCSFVIYIFADTEINKDALDHYNAGKRHYNSNSFNSAIYEFSNAIEIFPEYADAYLERGNCYDNKGDAAKALENYIHAGKYNDDYLLFAYGYECADDNVKDFDEAILVFTKCIDLGINTFISYCMRGNSHSGNEDFEEAIKDYEEAIKINPDIFQPYFSRAAMNLELGNIDLAINDYEISIKLCSDYHYAYYMLGLLYFINGDIIKSEEMMMLYNIAGESINI